MHKDLVIRKSHLTKMSAVQRFKWFRKQWFLT